MQNIFLVGPVRSGKSTIGRALAKELNLRFFDSDYELEREAGVNLDWVMDIEGETAFRKKEHILLTNLVLKKGVIIATGGGSILLPENRSLLSSHGKVVYLKTTIVQQIERNINDKKNVNENRKKLYHIKKLMKEREPFYAEISDITITTNEHTLKHIIQKITKILY
ncbi:UNVERIFIED_CONTAM: hypothetical protein GTU68_055726 [Idotea baltica]|nr:hypothetical protein [Idotea baltica]